MIENEVLKVKQNSLLCRIEKMQVLSGSLYRLFIRPQTDKLFYKPGQYLKMLAPTGVELAFSIANTCQTNNLIELHIRYNDKDANLVALINEMTTTHEVIISGPFGKSDYKEDSEYKVLILSVGTGFAPAKAILEYVFETKRFPRYLHLYWGVRYKQDFYLELLPKQWQENNNWFHYTPIVIQANSHESKKIDLLEEVLNTYDNFFSFQVYFFGPEEMAKAVQAKLLDQGLKENNLFSDML